MIKEIFRSNSVHGVYLCGLICFEGILAEPYLMPETHLTDAISRLSFEPSPESRLNRSAIPVLSATLPVNTIAINTPNDSHALASEVEEIGQLDLTPEPRIFADDVGTDNLEDYYRFSLQAASTVEIKLGGLQEDVHLFLEDRSGRFIAQSRNPGTMTESIRYELQPGDYFVVVRIVSSRSTPYSLGLQASFITDDTLVTRLPFSLQDPEFDMVGHQVSWQDASGNLWVAPFSPETGAFLMKQVQLVDDGLWPIVSHTDDKSGAGNGPEWAFSQTGSQLIYTKVINNQWVLHRAWRTGSQWQTEPLRNGEGGYGVVSSKDVNDSEPRIIYRVGSPLPLGQRITLHERTEWREISNPYQKGIINAVSLGTWVPGERSITYAKEIGDSLQIFQYNIDSGAEQQLTFDSAIKQGAQMWRAPEFNNELVFAAPENFSTSGNREDLARRVLIYRQINGEWQVVKTIEPPTDLPFIRYIRPFVYNNQSYIQMLSVKDNRSRVGAEIWIAGVAPEVNFYRQLNNPDVAQQPADPEVLELQTGLYVYYTDKTGGITYRVSSGLGPPNK